MQDSTLTRVSRCFRCNYRMDAASGLRKQRPDAGDISLCMRCGELHIFEADLTLRKPTARELVDIQTSQSWPEIERVRRAIRLLHEKIRRGELPPFSEAS